MEYEDYIKKKELLRKSDLVYRRGEALILDDQEWDELKKDLITYEDNNPEKILGEKLVDSIAQSSSSNDTLHRYPMLSLDNIFSSEDLTTWYSKLSKIIDVKNEIFTIEPKLDGLALSIIYKKGILSNLVTRGDGQIGESVLHTAKIFRNIPNKIDSNEEYLEVRGEAVITNEDFVMINKLRIKSGDAPFMNPRNGAAGALRMKEPGGIRYLTFIAYQLLPSNSDNSIDYANLEKLGFLTSFSIYGKLLKIEELYEGIEEIENNRNNFICEIDGSVIKLNSRTKSIDAGVTARAPRYAIAYKYPSEIRVSRLKSVSIQIGRTGILTPVANIEPVVVGGVTISHVTLHNFSEIKRKDIMLNDYVFVRRAGEVIPEITGIDMSRRKNVKKIQIPSRCPQCSSGLTVEDIHLYCKNSDCALLQTIIYFASRDCLDISGLGEAVASRLIKKGFIKTFSDIYELTIEDLLTVERFAIKSAEKLINEINKSKSKTLSDLITAFGFTSIGKKISHNIVKKYPTLELIKSANYEEICAIEGMGEKRAEIFISEFAKQYLEIEKIYSKFNKIDVKVSSNKLSGKKYVITGEQGIFSRNDLIKIIESFSGEVTSSVSKNTSALIYGDKAGSKFDKAVKLGVETVEISKFENYIAQLQTDPSFE